MEDSSPALAGFLSGKMLESELLEILAFRLLPGKRGMAVSGQPEKFHQD